MVDELCGGVGVLCNVGVGCVMEGGDRRGDGSGMDSEEGFEEVGCVDGRGRRLYRFVVGMMLGNGNGLGVVCGGVVGCKFGCCCGVVDVIGGDGREGSRFGGEEESEGECEEGG